MWVLKLNLLLVFFSFSKQDTTFLSKVSERHNIFIQTNKYVEKQIVTLWCNVSFNDQEFVSRVQWIEEKYPLRASNLEYLNFSTIKRIDVASFLRFPKDELCGRMNYTCKVWTKNRTYNESIYIDKCPSTELPVIIYWPNSYILEYWVKTLVVEEGSNIILKCVFYDLEWSEYWYKGNNTINFDERVSLNKLSNYISISNVNLNDTGIYRCVSPKNEFSTNVVVVKNYRKKSKKVVLTNSN